VILVLAATRDELPPGAPGVVCGVGPVDAAARTATAIAEERPAAVLNVGLAGARTFDDPVFVIGSESVYSDADDPRWVELRLVADARLVAAARRALPDARVAPIGTSARVGGTTACEFEAMEGFGVLRAAAIAGVPAVEVRVVSNAIAEPDRARWRFADAHAALADALPRLVAELEHA
jgi:futalosine hydrolase